MTATVTIAQSAAALRSAGWMGSDEHVAAEMLRRALVATYNAEGGGVYEGRLAGTHRTTGRDAGRRAYLSRSARGLIALEILRKDGSLAEHFAIGNTADADVFAALGPDDLLVAAYRLRGHDFDLPPAPAQQAA